jgi:hypothetical protein
MKQVTINFPTGFEDTQDMPTYIQLGRLILGDTACRLYFAEDGKMHMFCGHGAQEFIKFAPEPTEVMMYGFGAKP